MWNQKINNVPEAIGCVRFKTDHGVYVFSEGDTKVFIALYMDVLLMVWKGGEVLEMVKRSLQERYEMKDLGTATFLLGVELRRHERGDLLLVQHKYASELVYIFGMGDSLAISTPFEPKNHLGLEGCPKIEGERATMEGISYTPLAGSLMYLAIYTRSDLAMGVSTLSRFCQDPGMVHWEAAKRLLRYVKGSGGDGLLYCKGGDVELWGYNDASYGIDLETKRGAPGLLL